MKAIDAQRFITAAPRYEDRYGHFLNFFKTIAESEYDEAVNVPWSWVPLVQYLGVEVKSAQVLFEHCHLLASMLNPTLKYFSGVVPHLDRTAVETLCGFRPECVDALWKCDMQWATKLPNEGRMEFIVTGNGSFHRPEVLHYLKNVLPTYVPEKRKIVLVPCAADKPYPSVMHQAVLDVMPSDFYLCNATGVLGLVPQDLWPDMPHYDSGIPNEWRLKQVVADYFSKFAHDEIVVYCDYYSIAIMEGLRQAGVPDSTVTFINPVKFYHDYLDLTEPSRLSLLQSHFNTGK